MKKTLLLLFGLFTISLSAQINVVTRIYIDGTPYDVVGGGSGGGLLEVVEDLTPEFGGNVDGGFFNLTNIHTVTATTNGTFPFLTWDSNFGIPTDIEPTSSEGYSYNDDSENRPKYHDGTSWKAYLLEGDIAGGGTDDQVASEVPNTPSGTIAATDVQAALNELDTEKQSSLDGVSYSFGNTAGLRVNASGSLNQIDTDYQLQFRNDADAVIFTVNGLAGAKTLTGATGSSAYFPTISTNDDAYAVGWNGDNDVVTKNAIYDKIEAIASGVLEHPDTGETGIRIGVGTEAEKALATLVPGSDIWISTDTNPSETTTGTVLDMSGYAQTDDRVVDTATFTLSDIRDGGYHEILINEATEPNITGASKLPNTASFITATEMLLCVKVFGTDVRYFFVEW